MSQPESEINKTVNAFTVWKFLKMLTTPFNRTEAYKLGIIDKNGNYLKMVDDLKTQKEKNAVNTFTRMMFNIKKLLQKVPDPKVKSDLKQVTTALFLLKEEANKIGADGDYVYDQIMEFYSLEYPEENINEKFTNEMETKDV
jgi:hypothetical protein|tara:strand:- start:378 stop:803 length:426 start_codon:yes stop_codon:yes gene_type:complete